MYRQPANRQINNRGRTAQTQTLPPPIGGWNARDAYASMIPTDAIVLDNFFPDTNEVRMRKGFTEYVASGMGSGNVETLAEYNAGGSRKFLAGTNGNIYDISTSTASSLGSGYSEDKWQTANYEALLWFFNGTDAPLKYNGSTLAATGFTGPTITDLIQCHPFKNRLWTVEKDTASAWYTSLNGVTGALTEFDLKGIAPQGGDLVAINSITNDGGEGIDDLICFFMSSGAVLIYQGTDPGSDFALIGVFDVGELLDVRGVAKFGSDLAVMTRDGFKPLTRILPFGRASDQVAFSNKIDGAVLSAINSHSSRAGWEVVLYPRGPMMLFNIPQSDGFVQYVMNINTLAWCRFKGMDSVSWGMYDNDLYFGGEDGKVYQALTGEDDNGSNIECDGLQAFTVLGEPGVQKRFTSTRPLFTSSAELALGVNVSIDYEIIAGVPATTTLGSDAPLWDEAVWDVAAWGTEVTKNVWNSVEGMGYAVAIRTKMTTGGQSVSWNGYNIAYERLGGFY